MIKRWIKTIKWLFNHPPVSIDANVPEGTTCEFCGSDSSLFYFNEPDFAICHNCIAKSFRKINKENK